MKNGCLFLNSITAPWIMDPDRGSIIESLYKIAFMSKLSVSYLLNFLITQLQLDAENLESKSVSPNLGTRTVKVLETHFLIRTWEVSVSMFCSFVKWWNNKYCLCQLVHDFNMLKHVVFYWTTYWCYISFFIILLSFINIHKLILDRNRWKVFVRRFFWYHEVLFLTAT